MRDVSAEHQLYQGFDPFRQGFDVFQPIWW